MLVRSTKNITLEEYTAVDNRARIIPGNSALLVY